MGKKKWSLPGLHLDWTQEAQVNPDWTGSGYNFKDGSRWDPSTGSGREYVWTDDAACKGSDPEMFQLSQDGDADVVGMTRPQVREHNWAKLQSAQEICSDCSVRAVCLENATQMDRFWSVRGGELPSKLTEKLGVNQAPTWIMKGYQESWSCKLHGTEFKREYQRGEGKQVYCDACRA